VLAQAGRGLGGVLAELLLAAVHQGGDLRQVRPVLEVGLVRYPFGPKTLQAGEQRVDARPDPGVQDGGDARAPARSRAAMAEPMISAGSRPASSASSRVR
jgi:hypothetical protein